MFKNNIFRLKPGVLVILAVTLAFSITGCTVACNVPALINAINNANANPSPSTLNLSSGCTYTLTAVDNTATSSNNGSTFEYGDNGLPQITTPITINGNNANIVRSSGAPNFRIFFIWKEGSLTLNNITLQNGIADETGTAFPSSGGAVYNDGKYLEINNSTIEDNHASFHGGAIFMIRSGTTHINGSTIRNNEAPLGGGICIYHAGLLSISDSEISNNEATTEGGGINMGYGAELVINNSLIASNHSGRRGGGIFKDGGADRLATTITGTTFRDNSTDWSGGGIFIWRTPLTISDSNFINNQAEEYGGGLGYQNSYDDIVHISNTTFEENSAGWDGGAVHFSGKLMTISNCTIQNNTADNGAGVHNGPADDSRYLIRTDTEISITGGIVQENVASENGGGAYNAGAMTCGESTFVGNEAAVLGGGIQNSGTLEVVGCTFDKNMTGEDGGGIYNSSITEIRASTFSNNTSQRGGGFANVDGDADIRDSIFKNNPAIERGGAIFNLGTGLGSSPVDIIDTEIKDNTAQYGGGIASDLGDVKIVGSTISDNKATSEGGGIYNAGFMTVTQCILAGNESSTLGGGIHSTQEIQVKDSTFEGNLASADGGGLNTYDKTLITGSTFVGNKGFRGGGLASIGGETVLTNSTFSNNTAADSGGGIFNMGPLIGDTTPGGALLANFITVAHNSAPAGGGIATSGGGVRIKNSIVGLNPSGGDCKTTSADFSAVNENIDSDSTCIGFTLKDDPLLDTLANYGGPTSTHALKTNSPAIDAAPDCTTVDGTPVTVDQRGQPRPGGPVCDLGAYEDAMGAPLPQQKACMYTAKTNVFCRLGPDNTLYPVVDSFTAGQSAPAVGRSWDKIFAYVEGPTNQIVCAVPMTEKFGFLTGDCEDLEVMVPPDVDESIDGEEETGCTVRDLSGALICQVPCPPKAVPGDPCTP